MTVVLVLALVAFILGAIEQFNAKGRSLLGWAVIVIALALIIPLLSLVSLG